MNNNAEKVLKQYFYSFNIPSGVLILYGDNIQRCKPYLDDIVDSVEDICIYCKQHELKVYHKTNKNIKGLIGFIITYRLTKKYSVNCTWNDVCNYILEKSE